MRYYHDRRKLRIRLTGDNIYDSIILINTIDKHAYGCTFININIIGNTSIYLYILP